jgi:hypothetical protein
MSSILLSRALGAAGLGIGAVEFLAPKWLSNQLGVSYRPMLVRAMGAREIASGVGIVARHNPTPGQWTRVAGDVIDAALLGLAAMTSRKRKAVLAALGAVLVIGALDFITARQL